MIRYKKEVDCNGETRVPVQGNPGDYTTVEKIREFNGARPYGVYAAILSQTSTDAPVVVTELENNLGGDITWAYVGVGIYSFEGTGLFTVNRTMPGSISCDDPALNASLLPNNADGGRIYITDMAGSAAEAEGVIYVEIRVY